MTIADRTAAAQTESVSLEFDLPHSPARVWRALTEPKLLAEWLLPIFDFRLETDSAFTLKAQPHLNWDGTVDCQVLEIEAERKLRWSWAVDDIDTVVTFTLTPTASGTRLSLVQSGFKPDQTRNFAGARYGWRTMGEKLVEVLAEKR